MKKSRTQKRKANYTILLIVFFLILAIGYASFSDTLNISGTANAKGNFDVIFSNASLKDSSAGIDTTKSSAIISSEDPDILTIKAVDLTGPSSHADFEITIKNNCNIRAKVNSFTFSGIDNNSIFTVSGYEDVENAVLGVSGSQDDSTTFILTVALKDGITIDSENIPASFSLQINYEQASTNDVSKVLAKSVSSETDFLNTQNVLARGGTLTLTDNITFDSNTYAENSYASVIFPNNATLDLNSNKLTAANGAIIISGNNLTVQNGILEGTPDSYDRKYTLFWNNDNVVNGITINNVVSTGLNFYKAQNVVLNNCTVNADSKFYAVYGNAPSTITINSGTYKALSNNTALFGYSKSEAGVNNPTDGFKIYGGTFITNGKTFCLSNSSHIPPVIYGGTFDVDVTNYCADGYTCINNGDGTYTVQAQ